MSYLRVGTGAADVLGGVGQVVVEEPGQTQVLQDARVALLDPRGVGVELLQGVEGEAEEGPGSGVGLVLQDRGQDLRVSRGHAVLEGLQVLAVALDLGVVPAGREACMRKSFAKCFDSHKNAS